MGQAGRRADGAAGRRAKVESRRRSSKRQLLSFSLSCSSLIPSRSRHGWRLTAAPFPFAVGGRGGRAARRRRRRGSEARRRGGGVERLDAPWKVAHGCKRQETSIGVSGGRPLPSHGRVEASAAERPDSGAGPQRPRRSPSSSAPVLLRAAPSPHPSPAPLRVATRAEGDSASPPVGGGGQPGAPVAAAEAEGRHRPVHATQPAPLLRHDGGAPLSTTARSRGWRRPPFMSALGGGGGRQLAAARRRRRRPLEWLPCRPFGGSQLPPHECCEGPRVTFAVLPHCRLPPYPPIRVAPRATRRSAGPPGHPFPTNPTPPVQTTDPNTSTR